MYLSIHFTTLFLYFVQFHYSYIFIPTGSSNTSLHLLSQYVKPAFQIALFFFHRCHHHHFLRVASSSFQNISRFYLLNTICRLSSNHDLSDLTQNHHHSKKYSRVSAFTLATACLLVLSLHFYVLQRYQHTSPFIISYTSSLKSPSPSS